MDNELSSVVDLLPGLVWTMFPDGRLAQVNRAWCDYAGVDAAEVRRRGWSALVHPDDLPAWLDGWSSRTPSPPLETAVRLRRFDGVYRRFVLRTRPLSKASEAGWCGVAVEAEGCVPAERMPDLQEAGLRAVMDSVPTFIGLAAPSGGVEYFNRFALDYLGATLEEMEGWKATRMVHPDELPAVLAAWTHAVQTGEPYDFVHRVRRADGSYRWFQVRGLPMRDETGRITRWFVVNTDIDEQKRGEDLLAGEKQLLDMVARDRPPQDILDAFCKLVETAVAGCRCTVMLLDRSGTRMGLCAGPSLPARYIETIAECAIGTDIGPCPMAARLQEQIIAPDLALETRWAATRWPSMAMSHGLRCCWSTPIVAKSGESLGVFAIYYERPRSPGRQDLALIDQLTHIAGTAIERMHSRLTLRHALDDVRASEDRLRSIIDAIPGFVWSTAPDGSVDFLNQRWSEYTGMPLEEARDFGWTSAVHPDDAAALAAYWQALLEAGLPGEYEARLRRHDGVYRWFLIRAVPQRDETGRLVRWYGANTDIEDRKQAELLLAGEKRLLGLMAGGALLAPILDEACRLIESVLDGALCGVMLVDARRSHPARAGDASLYLQAGAAPTLPAAVLETVVGRVADANANPIALAATRGRVVISADLAHEQRWQLWRAIALAQGIRASWSIPVGASSGMAAGVLSILFRQAKTPEPAHEALIARFAHLVNIAIECARWEAALRQSEAFLAKAQRLSLTGTFSWRVEEDEIAWSEEIYRIVEVDPAASPTFDLLYTRIHPEDIPAFSEVFKRQRVEGRDFEHEHRLLMPDGRVKHVHLVAHANRDEDGGLEYIAAVQDITQRRLSEEALGKVRSELSHVARVATLGALTASIAHEVNQPLAGIITNASTCLRMLAADPPNVEGARETARRTIRDGNRASEVIRRLRALFAKKATSAERVDLNEAAREVTAMLLGELQRHSVILQPEFAEALPPVRGDRVQLQQVIVNLMLNAADAMQAVTDRPRQLRLSTHEDEDGRVCLAVRDNGAGLEGEDTERLFQAFYTTKSSGMGIGLSVSRSIIESHGGELWAAPNDGPGACFCFAVPAWSEAEGAVPAGGDGEAPGLAHAGDAAELS